MHNILLDTLKNMLSITIKKANNFFHGLTSELLDLSYKKIYLLKNPLLLFLNIIIVVIFCFIMIIITNFVIIIFSPV